MAKNNDPALAAAIAILLAHASAWAQDAAPAGPPPATPGPWSGEVAAGFITTEGNTKTRSLNGKLGLDYRAPAWRNAFQAASLVASDPDGRTAERYTVGDKVDYNFSPRNYAFGLVEYEKDRFGGIRERLSEAVGYGRHLLAGPGHTLDAEVGAGARQQKDQQGLEEAEAIGRASGLYRWQFSEGNAFVQNLKVESGESNTFTESVSELRLILVGRLAASGSFTARYNSHVPPDREKADLVTAANLSYTFGAR